MKSAEGLIYRSGRAKVLYFVSAVTVGLSVFVFYMIFVDLDAFLAEFSSRWWGLFGMAFMLIAGNVLLVCMLWLSGRYITQINETESGQLLITTWTIVGIYIKRSYAKTVLDTARYYEGKSNFPSTPSVYAPYSILKTPAGKKLLLDEQGVFYKSPKQKAKTKGGNSTKAINQK